MGAILRRLRITKVDFCHDGANPDAHIQIFKSMAEIPDEQLLIQKREIPQSHRDTMPAGSFAGPHESFPIEEPGDAKNAWNLAGHAANPDAVRRRVKELARRKGPAFVAALPQSAKISKEDTSVPKPNTIDITKASPEEVAKYIADLEQSLQTTETELAKAKKVPPKAKKMPPGTDDNDADDNKIQKGDDDSDVAMAKSIDVMKSEIAGLKAELAVAKADTAKASNEVAIAKAASELITIEKMVEKEMPKVPGTVTEVAKMLQEAKATLTAPSYAVLEKALKAGSEAIAKATTEIGSNNGRTVGSAEEEIFKQADDLVAKGRFKTRPEAVVHVQKTDTELAERYRVEKSNRK